MSSGRSRLVIPTLAAALALALLLATAAGSVPLPFGGVVGALLAKLGLPGDASSLGATGETILFTVRLPRVLLAALVGGGLAVVGAVLQAVFRNPLADSGLLGVGAGAALGAVLAVHLGLASAVFFALPLAAFAGALLAVLAVYFIAGASGRASLHGLLLTGIAVSALAGAMTSVLLVATEEFRVKTVLFWLAGGLDGRGWTHVQAAAAVRAPGRRRCSCCWAGRSTCCRSARPRPRRSACRCGRRAWACSASRRSSRAPRPPSRDRSRSSA